MPLIAAAYLSFAAGLLAGFGGFVIPSLVVVLAVVASGAVRRTSRAGSHATLATVAGCGLALATITTRADRTCLDLSGGRTVRVELIDRASPGRYARGRLAERGCSTRVSMTVERGIAPEGSRVLVRGAVVAAADGLVVSDATIVAREGPGIIARFRLRAGRSIDEIFRGDASLARALLIADTRSLDPTLRTRYADAGIVHLLSVSGLHVAVIAAAAELLLIAARAPRRGAALIALGATAAYVVVIGAPAPAVRSGVMLGVSTLSRLAQRPTSPWASLALGALLPLVDPRVVLELGYQLSVVGIAALIAAGSLSRRLLAPRLDGWRLTVARDLTASVVASLVTLPLIAWTFGRVSLIAPLTNVVAGPLFGMLQPMLFLALLLAPVRAAATFVADVAHLPLAAVDGLASFAAALPLAAITVTPTIVAAVALAGASAALLVACTVRQPARPALVAVGCLGAAVWLPLIGPRSGMLEMHMIDVGQGDAIALRTPRGRWIVVDAGRVWAGGDAGRRTVIPYLRRRGGELAAFVLSHPHADHVGGAASLIGAMRPGEYWDGAYVAANEGYRLSLAVARERGVRWRRVHPDDSMVVDGVTVRFLAPDSAWTATLDDANEASTVALVRFGRVRFLLAGDAERGEEEWLTSRRDVDLRADVLKVAHHGSSTSSTDTFLDAVQPRIALISVGAANSYGHPSRAVLRSLAARGALVLRTDQLGSIVIRTDGVRLTAHAGGERWAAQR